MVFWKPPLKTYPIPLRPFAGYSILSNLRTAYGNAA